MSMLPALPALPGLPVLPGQPGGWAAASLPLADGSLASGSFADQLSRSSAELALPASLDALPRMAALPTAATPTPIELAALALPGGEGAAVGVAMTATEEALRSDAADDEAQMAAEMTSFMTPPVAAMPSAPPPDVAAFAGWIAAWSPVAATAQSETSVTTGGVEAMPARAPAGGATVVSEETRKGSLPAASSMPYAPAASAPRTSSAGGPASLSEAAEHASARPMEEPAPGFTPTTTQDPPSGTATDRGAAPSLPLAPVTPAPEQPLAAQAAALITPRLPDNAPPRSPAPSPTTARRDALFEPGKSTDTVRDLWATPGIALPGLPAVPTDRTDTPATPDFAQMVEVAALAHGAAAPATGPAGAATANTTAIGAAVNLQTPVLAPEFREALGVQVSVLARDGVQQAELHLNPAEMGPISVRIELDGHQAQVNFGVDNATTRALVEAGLPELASALREAGLTLTGGGVSQHARGQAGDAQGGAPGEGGRPPGQSGQGRGGGHDEAADAAPPRPRSMRLPGGIDVYA